MAETLTGLDAIEARLKAATPGPWRTDEAGCCVYEADRDTLRGAVAHVVVSADGTYDDADLIAHAPSDISRLLAIARAAEDYAYANGGSECLFGDCGDCPRCVLRKALDD